VFSIALSFPAHLPCKPRVKKYKGKKKPEKKKEEKQQGTHIQPHLPAPQQARGSLIRVKIHHCNRPKPTCRKCRRHDGQISLSADKKKKWMSDAK
jgi:hypothetical protein